MSKAALCISGMGRSGTSLTTSWLEKCGLSVHDGQVLGANHGNPRGHFEDQEFLDFQEEVMTRQFPLSHGWKIIGDDFLGFNDEERARATALVERRANKFALWGWKDPRSIWFLPQWKQIVPELKVLLLWRPCAQVVRSHLKRSKAANHHAHLHVSPQQAAALWRASNERVCAFKLLFPEDTLLVSLAEVLQHDRLVFAQLNSRLGLGLEFRPLHEVLDAALLQRDSAWRRHFDARRFGSADLEQRLTQMSDLSPSPEGDLV